MKKFRFIIYAAIVGLILSCNNKKDTGMTDTARKNLDCFHAINKIFETGDLSKIGDYIAADGVDHAGMKGDVKGLDSIKAEFAQFSKMMSNLKSEVVKELTDDDYVIAWMKESGKMNMDGMGMKAGQDFSMDAIEVAKFRDGKNTDHWEFISTGDMMKMMPQQHMDNANSKESIHRRMSKSELIMK